MSLYYAETHEWAEINGKVATVGISDFAQGELGDIVFVELLLWVIPSMRVAFYAK